MPRKHWPLLIQLLLFMLVTLLSVATRIVTNNPDALPGALVFLRRSALLLAGVTVLLIIAVMIWQHRTDERAALRPGPRWDSDRSPYPGLEAFTEEDSAVFFGRDAEITELVDRLHPVVMERVNRLVAVVGPSGAGKSSLIQAGVVPRLRQRRGGWIVVPPMVPGNHPLHGLARNLAAARPGRVSEKMPAVQFADELRAVHGRQRAPVLLIVDQAEELITLCGETERDAFLGLLANAVDADPRLWIILIMRTEFLNAFLATAQARLFRDPFTVGTLGGSALVEVIQQPAHRVGLTFDPPTLPQQIAADAGGGDALPLLAYALQELCRIAGPGRRLTVDAYQRIGGVTGVLTRQADKVAAELGGIGPAGSVLLTLLKFVTIGENEPTRRRVHRSTLANAQVDVAEAFIAARLLTSNGDGDDAILEVAHEALFRTWAPLRQAIEASADQLRWRADLERWAKDWDNSGRQDAYLLHDERLRNAQQRAASDGAVVEGLGLVAEFLACSNRADQATMQRLSETVARQALGNVDSDPDYSLLLALAAYEEFAPTALAVRALTAALIASRVRVILHGHDDWVLGVARSPDRQRLATASNDRTARIWDARSGSELTVLHGHEDWVRGLAWSPEGRRLATSSMDHTARIWDADTGRELTTLCGHDDAVWEVAWSPDGGRLATVSRDHSARIWDTNNGTELTLLLHHGQAVWGVAWSLDGRRLCTASSDRTGRIWDTDHCTELAVLHGHDDWVWWVAWSRDSLWLASASRDRTARIWDAHNGRELSVLHGHDGEVRGVAWSPDGRQLVTGSGDGTVRVWDRASGTEAIVVGAHLKGVESVSWSPAGTRVASASKDGTCRIWDATVNIEDLVANAHRRVSRELSPEERRNLMLPSTSQSETS